MSNGSIVLSFQKFAEAQKIGKVNGDSLRVELPDGRKVLLRSKGPILPGDLAADVYVKSDPGLKVDSVMSTSVSTSDDVESVISHMRQRHGQK